MENFGESDLADRFGVERYPAIFIDEVLIARPKDFGFYAKTGRLFAVTLAHYLYNLYAFGF